MLKFNPQNVTSLHICTYMYIVQYQCQHGSPTLLSRTGLRICNHKIENGIHGWVDRSLMCSKNYRLLLYSDLLSDQTSNVFLLVTLCSVKCSAWKRSQRREKTTCASQSDKVIKALCTICSRVFSSFVSFLFCFVLFWSLWIIVTRLFSKEHQDCFGRIWDGCLKLLKPCAPSLPWKLVGD